jgi:hypothetical protein
MAISDIQVHVNDAASRNVTVSFEPGVQHPGLAEVQHGASPSYGGSAAAAPVVNSSRYAATFNAVAETFHFKILVDRDETPDQAYTIQPPTPTGAVDEISAYAAVPQLKRGQETDIIVSVASAGVATPNRTVEFSLDHGESSSHGDFNPSLAQSDANGEARSKFKPNRPGSIKLKVICEGQEAQLSVKVKP